RPDALEANTQPQPPDRQLREVVEPVRAGEGQSIVGTDRARQTMLGKDTPEGLEDTLLARRFEGPAAEEVSRALVGDRQGVTVTAIAKLELALEVGALQIIGRGRFRQRRSLRTVPCPIAGLRNQSVPVQHRMHRATLA